MELDDSILWDNQHPELHEGDVMLTSDKNAILSTVRLWPNATIPYVISSGSIIFHSASTQRKVIASVMNIYQNKTCLRFVPRTTQANYIRIRKSGRGYLVIFLFWYWHITTASVFVKKLLELRRPHRRGPRCKPG